MGPSTALRVSVLVLYSLIFVGSLVGNSLVLYIIAKKPNTRTAISFLFVNMAVADLIITIFVVPYSVAFYFRDYKWIKGIGGDVLCRFYTYCFTVAIAASIFTLTVMAFDRFMAVVFPLRTNGCCGRRVCTFCIWLSSTILMFPMPLTQSSDSGNCLSDWSLLQVDPAVGGKVVLTILFLAIYIIPLTFMIGLYLVICRKLWRHERPGFTTEEGARSVQRQSRTVVKLLITIVLVFALCWFPLHAFHMIVWAFPPKGLTTPLYVTFLCLWCGHAHSAINPWMYIYLNSKFRSTFLEIVGRRSQASSGRYPLRVRDRNRSWSTRSNKTVRVTIV